MSEKKEEKKLSIMSGSTSKKTNKVSKYSSIRSKAKKIHSYAIYTKLQIQSMASFIN
jgi:hypothetical protein